MARTALTPQTAIAIYPAAGAIAANAADFTFAAGDASNGNKFTATGREIIIARNTGAGARTITLQAAGDAIGREVDLGPFSIGAGEFTIFTQPLAITGWRQSDGQFYLDVEHAEVTLAVITLP